MVETELAAVALTATEEALASALPIVTSEGSRAQDNGHCKGGAMSYKFITDAERVLITAR